MGEKKENTPCLRDRNGLTEEEFLKSYNPGHYARPSVAADMAIFTVTDQEAGGDNGAGSQKRAERRNRTGLWVYGTAVHVQ